MPALAAGIHDAMLGILAGKRDRNEAPAIADEAERTQGAANP